MYAAEENALGAGEASLHYCLGALDNLIPNILQCLAKQEEDEDEVFGTVVKQFNQPRMIGPYPRQPLFV